MKHLLTCFAVFAVAIVATSCSKENISAEEFFLDSSRVAKTIIYPKNDYFNDPIVATLDASIIKVVIAKDGMSVLSVIIKGKLVYEYFYFNIYFENIDNMRVGDTLTPNSYEFGLLLSNTAFNAILDGGKITLAYLCDDYAILHFDNVIFDRIDGVYVTDGYLYCRLYDGGGTVYVK